MVIDLKFSFITGEFINEPTTVLKLIINVNLPVVMCLHLFAITIIIALIIRHLLSRS